MINEIRRISLAIEEHQRVKQENPNNRNSQDRSLYNLLEELGREKAALEQINANLNGCLRTLENNNRTLERANTENRDGKVSKIFSYFSIFTTFYFSICQSVVNTGLQQAKGIVQKFTTIFGKEEDLNSCMNQCLTSFASKNKLVNLEITCEIPKSAHEKLSLAAGIIWLILFAFIIAGAIYNICYGENSQSNPKKQGAPRGGGEGNNQRPADNSVIQLNNFMGNNP